MGNVSISPYADLKEDFILTLDFNISFITNRDSQMNCNVKASMHLLNVESLRPKIPSNY